MRKLTRFLAALLLVLSMVCAPGQAWAKSKIQIAVLLDSSNSMDGLIDQTRSQIWQIVNYLSKVTKNNEVPDLEVALYQYGNDTIPAAEGYTRLLTGFTPELDLVSEKLFSIRTEGGQEYAGWVINAAMKELTWSRSPEDFRVVFIAGNEPFDQGSVNWQDAVKAAVSKDTLVNTIYCGDPEQSERDLWATGATLARGSHFNIDQNKTVAFVESPFDKEIADLNDELNKTYLPYGEEGEVGQQRQAAADRSAGANLVTRGGSKASAYYRNASWDLVDALDDGVTTLEELSPEELPLALKGKSFEEQKQYIDAKRAERAQVQAKIREASQKRSLYLERQQQAPGSSNAVTLDQVIIQSLRQQLAAKGFKLQ